MYFFHRMLFPIMIRIMVIGMVSVAIAAPMPEGNPLMSSNGRGLDTIKQQSSITFNHSKDSLDQGCWNRPSQGGDGYSIALNEPYEAGCSSMVGVETTWMYAPGCTNLGFSGYRILGSGHCSVDDQLVTNFGNLVVHSSDRVLGRVDMPAQGSGTQKPLSYLVLVNQQKSNSLNTLSSTSRMNPDLMAQALRFDRLGHGLFDWDEANGVNLALNFDHQLVMSGKLAHLVPKMGKSQRGVELGDLVFLLLFAILPEKKQIKNLFRGIRQFQMF